MRRSTLKRLGIAILCGFVGLALDIWRQGSSAPLLLGRIVTLPVAILFGPWDARWPCSSTRWRDADLRGRTSPLAAGGDRRRLLRAPWSFADARRPDCLDDSGCDARGRAEAVRRRLSARYDPPRRAAGRGERPHGSGRRRSPCQRRDLPAPRRRRPAADAPSSRRRVSCVRARRDCPGSRARVGGRPADVGQAGR